MIPLTSCKRKLDTEVKVPPFKRETRVNGIIDSKWLVQATTQEFLELIDHSKHQTLTIEGLSYCPNRLKTLTLENQFEPKDFLDLIPLFFKERKREIPQKLIPILSSTMQKAVSCQSIHFPISSSEWDALLATYLQRELITFPHLKTADFLGFETMLEEFEDALCKEIKQSNPDLQSNVEKYADVYQNINYYGLYLPKVKNLLHSLFSRTLNKHIPLMKKIGVEGAIVHERIEELHTLTSLRELDMRACFSDRIEKFSSLTNLRTLSIHSYVPIGPLPRLPHLVNLCYRGNHPLSLENLSESLVHLQTCPFNREMVVQIAKLTSLTYLNLCAEMDETDFRPLSSLSSLEELHLCDSTFGDRDFERLTLPDLKILELSFVPFSKVDLLLNCHILQRVVFRYLKNLKDISPLKQLRSLREVWVFLDKDQAPPISFTKPEVEINIV